MMKSLLFSAHPTSLLLPAPRLRRLLRLRAASSASASAPPRADRRSPGTPSRRPSSSLYARPSLLDMERDRATRRADVDAFLTSLGVDPGELAGLELPVTVDVMRERAEFLGSLGLTQEDLAAYPLALGCSVRKNMVPVLDYLGKLGVRRDALPDLLRRYPQVLHASVVVDLAPVVKYLQGMDVRPTDVPRVLERYPELLGFKLEGTMSTSVAYLVGIGVGRRQVGSVITRFPEVLGMRVGKIIKPFVEHLEGIGLQRLAIARIIEKKPYVLGFGLQEKVKPNIEALVDIGVRKEALASIVMQYPDVLGLELRDKLVAQQSLFESSILVSREDFGRVLERMPQAISLGRAAVLKHVNFLTACGFMLSQVSKMVVACPQLLALNIDIMRMNFEYFKNEMERDLEELVEFPAFFTYGIESTVRPRHEMVSRKGLTCSLAWLLNCSDAKFDERMKYDTIGVEEMEREDSSDMNASVDEVPWNGNNRTKMCRMWNSLIQIIDKVQLRCGWPAFYEGLPGAIKADARRP
ncbi:transcription termination factor MTERF4, chloroplastic isoform X2 [Zea mays]|uniref:Transcription termination factor MTERF4, chloroplastic n=1 Tax=Zea mays TaxID=4577 RepID=A0A804QN61_MAIZE|nr:transcription termination factor MTERF4, chloroplastic isoform X2 [Zea mays]|eukprot:XP_023156545.1 transcription termination factor MTERF4, chloroplastic isoform X2 [Zea mays]